MSYSSKHAGHLIGENKDGEAKCYQCGEEIEGRGMFAYGYSSFGNPTNGKPDVMSPYKPSIDSYFPAKEKLRKGEID